MLTNIKVTNLFHEVKDLSRTEAFYRDVLGLPTRRLPGEDGAPEFLIASTAGEL